MQDVNFVKVIKIWLVIIFILFKFIFEKLKKK